MIILLWFLLLAIIMFLMGIFSEYQQLKRDARCSLGHGSAYNQKEWEKALIQAKADIEKEKIK